jgi:hypothetical protein
LSPAPPNGVGNRACAFYIFRTDLQLNKGNRLTARFNHSDTSSENFIGGGLNTLERSVDMTSVAYSLGVQLVSYRPKVLNELRFQYAHRETRGTRNEASGTGPSIVITSLANFGSPENADTINPLEKTTQIQDNLTWTSGTHAIKFGGGFNFIDDLKRSAVFARYTFSSIAAYIAARNGTNLRSYANYIEAFGDVALRYRLVEQCKSPRRCGL